MNIPMWTMLIGTEPRARGIGELLVDRGHSVVALQQGQYDHWWVSAVDRGPYRDDDAPWWIAAEQRFLNTLDTQSPVSIGWILSEDQLALHLTAATEIIADRTVDEVRAARLGALAQVPARAPRPDIEHRLSMVDASSPICGRPIDLVGLDEIDWGALEGAYGPAGRVPGILRGLAANNRCWGEATFQYFCEVVHQDTCFSCTPATIPFLVQIACSPELSEYRRWELLHYLAYTVTLDEACRRALAEVGASLFGLWPRVSDPERAWLTVLAAAGPPSPFLADLRAFTATVRSPALDLAVSLAAGDRWAAQHLILDATTWDERVPDLLDHPLNVLYHLASQELFAVG